MQGSHSHFLAAIAVLAATLGLGAVASKRDFEPLRKPLETIPAEIAGWKGVTNETLNERVADKLRPTAYLARVYEKGPHRLGLFIAYYGQQRAGENIHSPRQCLPGGGWEIWDHSFTGVSTRSGPARINVYRIQKDLSRATVLYWYQTSGQVVASEYAGKFLLVKNAVFSGRTAASIVRITLKDEPGATAEGTAFANALLPALNEVL